jgi:ABC-2 type transport system permease protein
LRRELVLKELRLFFRDTTQWSQLILLGVLVVVYVFNIKYLPLRGEGITFFLVNVVPFLNLVLAGFVLASIAARFIFPAVSLEGRTLWLLRSSPLAMRDLLWAKFWVGTLPLLILALGIVVVTNYLLQVSVFMFLVSVLTITLMTFAIAGLAIGFGTMFPQFETENAAQIPTSFGGLLFMMTSVLVIGGVIFLEARPVYRFLTARLTVRRRPSIPRRWSSVVRGAAVFVATFAPLALAEQRPSCWNGMTSPCDASSPRGRRRSPARWARSGRAVARGGAWARWACGAWWARGGARWARGGRGGRAVGAGQRPRTSRTTPVSLRA